MGKNEIHWAIFSGKILLSFTIRSTKYQCIEHFLKGREQKHLHKCESCKKVVINEFGR